MEQKNKTAVMIVIGTLVFFLRFLPVYHHNVQFFDQWFSIAGLRGVCSSFVGNFISQCPLITFLDWTLIIIGLTLIGWGVYVARFKKKV